MRWYGPVLCLYPFSMALLASTRELFDGGVPVASLVLDVKGAFDSDSPISWKDVENLKRKLQQYGLLVVMVASLTLTP